MDSKILYTNDDAEIQCVAVKSIETVRNAVSSSRGGSSSANSATTRRPAEAKPQRSPLSSSSDVIFLLPHESLYSYLYIGAADGTLIALRFQIFLKELAVPGGGLTYEHRVALEAQSKAVITVAVPGEAKAAKRRGGRAQSRRGPDGAAASPTTAADAPVGDAARTAALGGVRAIHAPLHLPYLFLLVHGRFEVHEDDTLQLVDPAYTDKLDLADAVVLLMCAGEEQSGESRRRRPPTSAAYARTASQSEVDVSLPAAHYALLLEDWVVVLVECTKTAATRLAFVDGAAEAAGWSSEDVAGMPHASLDSLAVPLDGRQGESPAGAGAARRPRLAETLLPVHPNTSTMAWCGDVLITGSPEYYCLYDTLHGTVLSQLEVGTLLGGSAPYTAYIRSAAVDPDRAGYELATESAEVCSYSGGSSGGSSGSSRSSSASSSSSSRSSRSSSSYSSRSSSRGRSGGVGERGSDERNFSRDGHTSARRVRATGWPSALVFRLRGGQLHICAGAGRTDLTAAAPIAGAFGGVREVHSCPPFLLCQRGGSSSGGGRGEEDGDAPGQKPQRSTSRLRASLAELRRASQQLSAKLAESRRPAQQCEMLLFSCLDGQPWTSPEVEPVSFMSVNLRGVRAFPLGLLGVSRHMVEGLLWKPFAVQLEDQIETGHYARVLRFVSQCFRGSEAARRVVLRRVCQASATRAMSRHRYRVAFYFYTLAETGVDSLLRLFPELQRPLGSSPAGEDGRDLAQTASGSQNWMEEWEYMKSTTSLASASAAAAAAAAAPVDTAGRGDSRRVSFVERHSRQFSYTSHAPYRALYRILISQFFALVAASTTAANSPVDSPASPDGPTTAAESQEHEVSHFSPDARKRSDSLGAAATTQHSPTPPAAAAASGGGGGGDDADRRPSGFNDDAPRAHSADDVANLRVSLPVTPTAVSPPLVRTPTPTSTPTLTAATKRGSAFATPSQPATPAAASHGAVLSPSWPASPLLRNASTVGGTPAATAAALVRTRANVEFALFCLFAMDCAGARRLRTTRDELLHFMVAVRTLNREECVAVVTALGLPAQSLLMTMLQAANGDFDAALAQCQADGDVAAAGATLAMYARTSDATGSQLETLYQLHLPWMLAADPPTAVQLLTTPAQFAGEKPGPAALLPILLTVGGTVLLDYVSYLINSEGNTDAAVHHLYATHLIRTLHTLREEWGLQGFASVELGAADGAGAETGLVGHLRRALLSFLQCSPFYDKERVLAALVEADLHEEQCVVLEALEDHIGVLTVLVYAMKDVNRAVRYCEAHYAQDRAHVHQWLPLTDLLPKPAGDAATSPTGSPGAGRATSAPSMSPTDASGFHEVDAVVEGRNAGGVGWRSAASPNGAVDDPLSAHAAASPVFDDAGSPRYTAAPDGKDRPASDAEDALNVLLFPSRDCHRVASNEAAAMTHYTHESAVAAAAKAQPPVSTHIRAAGGAGGEAKGDDVSLAVAPPHVAAWHPIMRFNQYLHMLLHVLLVPPTGSVIALPEIVWLLSTHSPYMSPRLVLSSLPGDVPLAHIAPYLIRAFQRLELNHQLVRMEAAAVQSALDDAVRRHLTLQQRCVWMDDRRRCVVCGEVLERGGLVVVFPNLKPAHFRCHQDGTLDPERAVPFVSNVL